MRKLEEKLACDGVANEDDASVGYTCRDVFGAVGVHHATYPAERTASVRNAETASKRTFGLPVFELVI